MQFLAIALSPLPLIFNNLIYHASDKPGLDNKLLCGKNVILAEVCGLKAKVSVNKKGFMVAF